QCRHSTVIGAPKAALAVRRFERGERLIDVLSAVALHNHTMTSFGRGFRCRGALDLKAVLAFVEARDGLAFVDQVSFVDIALDHPTADFEGDINLRHFDHSGAADNVSTRFSAGVEPPPHGAASQYRRDDDQGDHSPAHMRIPRFGPEFSIETITA